MEFKQKQERMTGSRMVVSAVVNAYNSKVIVASSEKVTHGFVDSANVVWECMLRHVGLQQLVVASEEQFGKGTPFDSVYKLEAIVRKADRDIDAIMWQLTSIVDLVLNQEAAAKDFSIKVLTGKGCKNNRGSLCQS